MAFSEKCRAIFSFSDCPILPPLYQNARTSLYKILQSAGQGPTFQNIMLPPSSYFIKLKALYFSTLLPSFFTLKRSVMFNNNYNANILIVILWKTWILYSEGICFSYGTRYDYTTNIFADSPQLFQVNAGMKPYKDQTLSTTLAISGNSVLV